MFIRVALNSDDQFFLRYLYREKEYPRELNFSRIPFFSDSVRKYDNDSKPFADFLECYQKITIIHCIDGAKVVIPAVVSVWLGHKCYLELWPTSEELAAHKTNFQPTANLLASSTIYVSGSKPMFARDELERSFRTVLDVFTGGMYQIARERYRVRLSP